MKKLLIFLAMAASLFAGEPYIGCASPNVVFMGSVGVPVPPATAAGVYQCVILNPPVSVVAVRVTLRYSDGTGTHVVSKFAPANEYGAFVYFDVPSMFSALSTTVQYLAVFDTVEVK
jgi:hypothetical protein